MGNAFPHCIISPIAPTLVFLLLSYTAMKFKNAMRQGMAFDLRSADQWAGITQPVDTCTLYIIMSLGVAGQKAYCLLHINELGPKVTAHVSKYTPHSSHVFSVVNKPPAANTVCGPKIM